MRRIDMILLFLILCISLPVVSGFAYRPDTDNDRLNQHTIESSESWASVNVGDDEPKGKLQNSDVNFSLDSMIPDCLQKTTWIVVNSNSFECYLDLEKINITSNENGCLEPEIDAGDKTPDEGELNNVVWISLFIDKNRDESYNSGDLMIYNGAASSIAYTYDLNESIGAGNDVQITALFEWISTANCNVAMGDDLSIDVTFELAQTAGQ